MTQQHDFTETIFGEPPPPVRRRRDRHRKHPRRSNRRWLVLLLAIVLVGGACYGAYSVLSPMVSGLFTPSDEFSKSPDLAEALIWALSELMLQDQFTYTSARFGSRRI